MTAEKINGNGGQATTTYPPGMSRRRSADATEQRKATRAAELAEAVAETLAEAPPPAEWQLALLARLVAARPVRRTQARRSA